MLVQALLLLLSLATLYYGAELALGSAEKIGKSLRLSPLVIGLVIVGFGTSLPELFVSQLAAMHGRSDIALGNIIGSNVANLFLILGITGLFAPLILRTKEIFTQLVLHLGITLTLIAVMTQAQLTLISSIVLLLFFAAFIYLTVIKSAKEEPQEDEEIEPIGLKAWVKLFSGFVLLYAGGELLVSSGTKLGELAGISPFVISAIFVALGTSFPELVTSLLAVKEGRDLDLVTGNILGSNVFNASFILGSLGIHEVDTSADYRTELWSLLGVSLFLLFLYWRGLRFYRVTGILFLLGYAGLVAHWISL